MRQGTRTLNNTIIFKKRGLVLRRCIKIVLTQKGLQSKPKPVKGQHRPANSSRKLLSPTCLSGNAQSARNKGSQAGVGGKVKTANKSFLVDRRRAKAGAGWRELSKHLV